jgi:hypothetical protein
MRPRSSQDAARKSKFWKLIKLKQHRETTALKTNGTKLNIAEYVAETEHHNEEVWIVLTTSTYTSGTATSVRIRPSPPHCRYSPCHVVWSSNS